MLICGHTQSCRGRLMIFFWFQKIKNKKNPAAASVRVQNPKCKSHGSQPKNSSPHNSTLNCNLSFQHFLIIYVEIQETRWTVLVSAVLVAGLDGARWAVSPLLTIILTAVSLWGHCPVTPLSALSETFNVRLLQTHLRQYRAIRETELRDAFYKVRMPHCFFCLFVF